VDLYFNTGSTKLRPESEAKLREFEATLKTHPDSRLTLGGYTDNIGDAGQNMKLSQKRADAVMAQLTRRGIAADRVTANGYGEDNPIAENGTATGRAKNRRVSVGLTE
jgi:outer membrane protein OmpA-like peptidoglycan-associated protein